MQAMILAAGLGTRLRPLTHDKPKALVEVGGLTMLERVARNLVEAGADRLVINVHHFADRVKTFIERQNQFGVDVRISHEVEQALETGGGIKFAREHFRPDEPFLVHNVDILTNLNLPALYEAHQRSDALATLAVRPAESHRVLLFDRQGQLCGYGERENGELVTVRDCSGELQSVDFMGVQVISPRIFDLLPADQEVFSIINLYLRLAGQGEVIQAFEAGEALWQDIGTHERLEKAEQMVRK